MLLLCVESDLILFGPSLRHTLLKSGGRKVLPDGKNAMPTSLSSFLSVCLSVWYACMISSISTSLLYSHPVPLSVWLPTRLSTCPFYLTDLVSYHRQSLPPSSHPVSSLVPTSLSPPPNIFFPISLHIIFSCLQRKRDSWLSFIMIHRVTEANLQGTRQGLFVKLLFIWYIKSSSSSIKEPRTVALDSHITLVSFGDMTYCLI